MLRTYAFETLVFPSLLILVRHRENTSMTPLLCQSGSCVHSLQNGIAHACSAQRMLLHLRSTDFSRFYTEGVKSPVSASKVLSKIGGLCFCTQQGKLRLCWPLLHCLMAVRDIRCMTCWFMKLADPCRSASQPPMCIKIVYGCMHTQIESPYSNLCSAY